MCIRQLLGQATTLCPTKLNSLLGACTQHAEQQQTQEPHEGGSDTSDTSGDSTGDAAAPNASLQAAQQRMADPAVRARLHQQYAVTANALVGGGNVAGAMRGLCKVFSSAGYSPHTKWEQQQADIQAQLEAAAAEVSGCHSSPRRPVGVVVVFRFKQHNLSITRGGCRVFVMACVSSP